LGDNGTIFIHSATPEEYSHFDCSLLVVWSIAVVAVSAGSYWSGIIRHDLMYCCISAVKLLQFI